VIRGHAAVGAAFIALVVWPPAAHAYRPFNSTDAAVAGRGMEFDDL